MADEQETAGLLGFHGKHTVRPDEDTSKVETSDEFVSRMSQVIRDSFVANMLAIGSYLGLFELMAEAKQPQTAAEIAKKGGFKERYIREWLSSLACARVIDVSEDGLRFSLSEHRLTALTGYHMGNMAHMATVSPSATCMTREVIKCFPLDGPAGIPFSEYDGVGDFLALRMKMTTDADLRKFFGNVQGLTERLEAGIQVLEVGGHSGHTAIRLATMFPKSTFISSDIMEREVVKGKQGALDLNLSNLCFQVVDASGMPAEWSNRFDLVFAIEVYHDIPRADLAMSETYRVLKPGGILLFNDHNTSSSLKNNLPNPMVSMTYAASTLCCLPMASAVPDSLALGAAWGKERAVSMLKTAGFINPGFADENAVDYLCVKE